MVSCISFTDIILARNNNLKPAPPSGQLVRLRKGKSPSNGYVEMFSNNKWGYVCDAGTWTMEEANVVCKQLGFKRGVKKTTQVICNKKRTILRKDYTKTGTRKNQNSTKLGHSFKWPTKNHNQDKLGHDNWVVAYVKSSYPHSHYNESLTLFGTGLKIYIKWRGVFATTPF